MPISFWWVSLDSQCNEYMILWPLGDALVIFAVSAVICLILVEIGFVSGIQGNSPDIRITSLKCDLMICLANDSYWGGIAHCSSFRVFKLSSLFANQSISQHNFNDDHIIWFDLMIRYIVSQWSELSNRLVKIWRSIPRMAKSLSYLTLIFSFTRWSDYSRDVLSG
jgi:hypothetical protein